MVDKLDRVFLQIIDEGLTDEIKSWDGCFNVRMVRGSKDTYSLHSWGIAVDINAATNALGADGDMHPRLVEIFKAHGFDWGGDFKRVDKMHFQLSAI